MLQLKKKKNVLVMACNVILEDFDDSSIDGYN